MNKIIIYIYILVVQLWLHLCVFSKPLCETHISVEAYWLEGPVIMINSPEGMTREPSTRRLLIYITNKADKTVRVPTEFLSLERRVLDSLNYAVIKWSLPLSSSRYNLIIPESRIGIVELRKKESVHLSFEVPKDWPTDKEPKYLLMEIPKKIWERYNLDYFDFKIPVD
jgi:hypothetical protein